MPQSVVLITSKDINITSTPKIISQPLFSTPDFNFSFEFYHFTVFHQPPTRNHFLLAYSHWTRVAWVRNQHRHNLVISYPLTFHCSPISSSGFQICLPGYPRSHMPTPMVAIGIQSLQPSIGVKKSANLTRTIHRPH